MTKETTFDFLHLVHVVKEPNTFKHSDNVRDHLKNIRNYFEQTKCPDNLKVQLFLKYLSLGVLEDLKLQLEYNDKVDLDWYEDKMLELYDDRRSLVSILVELVEIKQRNSESTIDFASRIKEKVGNKKIPINMQENIKLQLFINGLRKKNYSKALHILNPKTINEAVNMLRLDFNALEVHDESDNHSKDQVSDYLTIIKSLCNKINPSYERKEKEPLNTIDNVVVNSDSHPISEEHKSLLNEILNKLQNPDSKGIIIFPKTSEKFKILEIPKNDLMVGIPFENQSYEIVSCKKDSGYLISDSLMKKHTVYKLPSDETFVIHCNGKIRFVKKPTLIGPSKSEKKMEIITLPSSLVNENKIPLSCEEIISRLESRSAQDSLRKNYKIDMLEKSMLINPLESYDNINSSISYSKKLEQFKANSIDSQSSECDCKNSEIPFYKANLAPLEAIQMENPQFSDFNYLSEFHSPQSIIPNHFNINCEYLSDNSSKELENGDKMVMKTSACSISPVNSSIKNSSGSDDILSIENINLPSSLPISPEQAVVQNPTELPVEKTIGRFKIISTPQN